MTNPAAETKSIGLLADAPLSWFLHRRLDSFIVTGQLLLVFRDLVTLTVSPGRENLRPFTGTVQKLMPTLTQTATPYTTGPLCCNNIFRAIYPLAPGKVCGSTVTNPRFIGIKIFNQEGLSNLCRKPAYASQATFYMTLIFVSSGQPFFNLYLTRLAPMQACRWQ